MHPLNDSECRRIPKDARAKSTVFLLLPLLAMMMKVLMMELKWNYSRDAADLALNEEAPPGAQISLIKKTAAFLRKLSSVG